MPIITYRIAWHDGFGGTHTAETTEPAKFIHDLGHVDWIDIFGAYFR
jgi:hypothetical protein